MKLKKKKSDRQNIQLEGTTRLPWQLASMWSMTSVRIQCKLYWEMNCHVSDIDRSERGKKRQRCGWARTGYLIPAVITLRSAIG